VSERRRHEYVLQLRGDEAGLAGDASVRHPVPEDAEALAVLMLDAYRGTIDYDDEGLDEARDEVSRYLAGRPLFECSWVRIDAEVPVSACLVGWSLRECPIVSYVMTAARAKSSGFASDLLARSLASLAGTGQREVCAWITEGNVPSEIVFARAGFRRR
jgi:hypothetical protein